VSTVEDRTRAAMDAITETVDRVPLLRLPPPADTRSRGRAPSPRRWSPRLAPVAAAAAVLALTVALVVVKDIPRTAPAAAPTAGASGVPRYYVTLYTPPQPTTTNVADLLVGDTVTGAKVAIVPPPRGATFVGIAAAADDRTFVVDTDTRPGVADPSLPRTWYLLRIAPGTSSPAHLTKLPIPALTGSIGAIALSGSGRELAVALQGASDQLLVFSVPSGKLLHRWSTTDRDAFGDDSHMEQSRGLAWIDGDRAVAFGMSWLSNPPGAATVKPTGPNKARITGHEAATLNMAWRRLDVDAGGSDLMADSKVIWSTSAPSTEPYSSGCLYGQLQQISADGKTVVCGSISIVRGTERKPVSWRVAWLAYSVPAGSVRTLYQVTVRTTKTPYSYGLWTSASGNTMIGEWGLASAGGPSPFPRVGVVSDGRFQQLPPPPDAGALAPSACW
jgi:hypothetical protein